ncbi:MAG: hypothetical protein V3R73_05340 [Sphingomonadales bacterium]
MIKHLNWRGVAVASGGAFMIITNVVFSPLLPMELSGPEMMASDAFLWRLSLASLAVFLLMIGLPGLYRYQSGQTGRFGMLAFGLAFIGSAALFAHEWAQVFYVHPLALVDPEALQAVEDAEGLNLYTLEAMIAAGTFAIGWLAFSASMLMAKVFTRLGPALVIAGFFAVPLLTVALGTWGAIMGTVVLGAGWIVLGRELIKGSENP